MKVAVSGFYGYDNAGDEAIAQAIVQELRQRGHTALLLSQTPAATAQGYGCEAAARMQPLALARAIGGSDLLFSGGGGLLQDKTSARNLLYYLGIIRLGKLLGKRTVVFNQSIGPLSQKGSKRVAASLDGVLVIVRDQQSLETLARLGVMAQLGGDPALLLRPSETLTPDQNAVIIAPRGDVQEAMPALQEVSRRLRERGRKVIALSFYPREDDLAAQQLGAERVISVRSPQEALDTIASAGQVIGVRLHALILAAAAGVPFVGLSYDPKVSGFCQDAGAPARPTTASADQIDAALRLSPDWKAVRAMQRRAAESFDWALETAQERTRASTSPS